jgi:hypothetical protein
VNGAISEITALHSIFSSHGTGTVIQADKHRSLDHALRSHRLRVERHDGIDNTYRDAVDGIYQYTDDSIQFPRMICDELIDYGNRLRQRYKQQFRGSVRRYRTLIGVNRKPKDCFRRGNDTRRGTRTCCMRCGPQKECGSRSLKSVFVASVGSG